MLEYKNFIIYNYTPHDLDFAVAAPNSLSERKVDYTVPSDGVLTAEPEDIVDHVNGVAVIRRRMRIPEEHIKLLQSIFADAAQKGKIAVVYVSLPYLLALKEIAYPRTGPNYVVGAMVAATQRHVKPPVGSWLIVSV